MQLDVESLRTLVAVVDQGGMTRAAETLHLTQSAVSWKIRRLEDRVGRPLLIREGRQLRASKDGEELLDYARAIIATHDEAVARLTSSELNGTVRIGANEEVGSGALADLVARFDRVHAGVRVQFRIDQSLALADALDRGLLDVAVLQVGEAQVRPGDRVLWRDELAWVTGAASAEFEQPIPLVTFGDQCCYRPLAIAELERADVRYRQVFSGPSSLAVESAVIAGLGVALLSERRLGDELVPWSRSGELGVPPTMVQVRRLGRDADEAIAGALGDELVSDLTPPT